MERIIFGKNKRELAIGIDFGTVKSAAAVKMYSGRNTVQLVRSPITSDLGKKDKRLLDLSALEYELPMLASIGHERNGIDLKVYIGKIIKNYEPIDNFKLAVGQDKDHNIAKRIYGAGAEPEGLAAVALAHLYSAIRNDIKNYNYSPREVTISMPAGWSYKQRKALALAGKVAGFTKVNLVQEPLAALYAILQKRKSLANKLHLIIDYGGGTCDPAVVDIRDRKMVLKTMAAGPFGGRDIDLALGNYILEKNNGHIKPDKGYFDRSRQMSAEEHADALSQFRVFKEHRNNILKKSGTSIDELEGNKFVLLPLSDFTGPVIERELSDSTIRMLINENVSMLTNLLENKFGDKFYLRDIKQVFVVGGSSQLYGVEESIESIFKKFLNKPSINILRNGMTNPEETARWSMLSGCVRYQEHILSHNKPPDWHIPDKINR